MVLSSLYRLHYLRHQCIPVHSRLDYQKSKRRHKKIPLYGASIVHIGFVITLIAHLIGGLYSFTEPPVSVADEWTDLGGVEMKVTDLKTSSYPNGMPKIIEASVTVRKDGIEFSDTLGYNNPVLLQHGILEILMRDYGWIASSVVLKVDDRICTIKGERYIYRKWHAGTCCRFVHASTISLSCGKTYLYYRKQRSTTDLFTHR